MELGFAETDSECELVTYRVRGRRVLSIPDATVLQRRDLPVGYSVQGPAILQQPDTTIWLPSYARGRVDGHGFLVIEVDAEQDA